MNNMIRKDTITGESFFPDDGYILSETDEKGIITYANPLFCAVAQYSTGELVGQPHNIIRHTDMPRVAFKDLWDDIQSKGFWTGHVKNRSKDGGFYWVYATVIKMVQTDGSISYLSVRMKPSREDVKKYEELYSDLRAKE